MMTLLLNHTRDEETPSLNPQGINTSFKSHKGWTISPSNSNNTQSHKNPFGESYRSITLGFSKLLHIEFSSTQTSLTCILVKRTLSFIYRSHFWN